MTDDPSRIQDLLDGGVPYREAGLSQRFGRDDTIRLRELIETCKRELPGRDVPHICDGAQKVLAKVRSLEVELDPR